MEGWSLGLLDGLSQEVHAHLPHPLQALLLCVAGESEDTLTDTLAKARLYQFSIYEQSTSVAQVPI